MNVPVKVYSATEDHDIKFHQVHAKDNGRIRYKRVCEVCGEVVEYRDIARAFESDDGQMVVITDEDIATLPEERSREIEVLEFVPASEIDPMMYDRSYFLEPDAKSSKSYVLLAKTLAETGMFTGPNEIEPFQKWSACSQYAHTTRSKTARRARTAGFSSLRGAERQYCPRAIRLELISLA